MDDAKDSMENYLHIPEAHDAVLVDKTKGRFEEARDFIDGALLCGFDCEWRPEETGHRPAALLLQLALWHPISGLKAVILVRIY